MVEHPIRVLLIDDDEDDYIIVRDILNDSDVSRYYVEWVSSFTEAQHYISEVHNEYDVFVVDFFLGQPNQHGLKIISELRIFEPFVPIILLTGVGDYNTDIQAMRLGATDYIVKDNMMVALLERSIRYSLEHGRSMRSLATSQKRYRSLFEQSNDAVALINLDGSFMQCNQRLADMLGYTVAELNSMRYRDVVSPSRFESAQNVYRSLLEGEAFEIYESEMLSKDGTIFPTEVNVEVIQDEWGNLSHIQAIIRDISERKKVQEQQTLLDVERRQKLNLMNLLKSFSHDLRTPLSIINTSLHLLENIDDPQKQRQKLDVMRNHTNRLIRIIEDVLEVAQLEFATSLSCTRVNAHLVLSDVVQLVQSSNVGDMPQIALDLNADRVLTIGDISMLYKALEKLVHNAVTYTPADGQVTIRTQDIDAGIKIKIIDNGQGISSRDLPDVFGHFFRADQARSVNTNGSGLGLPIARRIITLHAGTIEIESTERVGTTVTVILPRSE